MNNPVIVISGFGQSQIVLCDKNSVKIKNLWPFELNTEALADQLKGSLMKMMLFRKDAGFSDTVAKLADDLTAPLKINSDGTRTSNTAVTEYNNSFAACSESEKCSILKMLPLDELCKKTGEDKTYYFAYDFLGDAYEAAEKLNTFVEKVKNEHGCEKVDFVCISIGGVVLRAYLELYGDKKSVADIVTIAGMLDGTELAADILEGKIRLDNTQELLSLLGDKASSISGVIAMLPPDAIENTVKKSLEVFKKNLILNCTMMWGAVPSSRLSAVLGEYPNLNENIKSKAKRLSDMCGKIGSYDVNVFAVCGSGLSLLPVGESRRTDTDGILTVDAAASGVAADSVFKIEKLSHVAALRSKKAFTVAGDILSGNM